LKNRKQELKSNLKLSNDGILQISEDWQSLLSLELTAIFLLEAG
jgi:hypothetical protein